MVDAGVVNNFRPTPDIDPDRADGWRDDDEVSTHIVN